jgi:hypothetical protein
MVLVGALHRSAAMAGMEAPWPAMESSPERERRGEERGKGRGLLPVGRREAPWGELHQDGGSVPAVHVLYVLLEFLHEEEETGKRAKTGEKKEKKMWKIFQT